MSTSVIHTEQHLEIAEGNRAWRQVHTNEYSMPWLRAAAILAQQGSTEHALNEAKEAWIAKHGQMHNIAFRVCIKTETYVSRGNYESCIKTPQEIREAQTPTPQPAPTRAPQLNHNPQPF
jgi:hypothetical protein